jgi:hypothetical protein
MNEIWVCSTDGKVLTGEHRSTQRKTCPSAILCTINLTRIGLGSNQGLCFERPMTDHLIFRQNKGGNKNREIMEEGMLRKERCPYQLN